MSRVYLSLVCLFTLACEAPLELEEASTLRRAESTPEAFGVLALLNDASTDLNTLDDNAKLDARAARSLIAHRNGPDRRYQTADDNPFDTLAEVDNQYYVGKSALKRLELYAAKAGFVPGGSDIVGEWEGVSFTMDEVTDTLALSNTASFETLDDVVGLNSRAAKSIVAERPLSTMHQLAQAKYVGSAALSTLQDYVIDTALGGAWDECDTSTDCQDGLVCMGELAWGTGIYCVDDSMYGTFSYDTSHAIADNSTELSTQVTVSGLATVPVDVVLTLDIDHPRPSDLIVTIDNFNGYSEVVWNNDSNPSSEIIVRAFPSDDAVNGTYSVHIEDTVSGQSGTLLGWDLYIVSNWD